MTAEHGRFTGMRLSAKSGIAVLAAGLLAPSPVTAEAIPSTPSAAVTASGSPTTLRRGQVPVVADSQEPGSELRVWLVTAGPGDAVWERYGHNAIRVLDTRTGRDVSYNWGIFDFQQDDFIPRFLQGRMLYMMAPFPTAAMIEAYGRANREIVLQELDLTPAQKAELHRLAEINARPENRDYTYHYFLDNCSTRVRDLLDQVLGGALEDTFGGVDTGTSYRFHTRRLTQVDPLIYTGMDMLLGTLTDQPITVWEEMFLPLTLRDEIRGMEVRRGDGSTTPLVLSEEVVVPSTRSAIALAPPSWMWAYLLLGLGAAAVFVGLGSQRAQATKVLRRGLLGLASLWLLLAGIAGTLLVLLLFTDHGFAYWNENLFLFHPLLLVLAVLLPFRSSGTRWNTLSRRLAMVVAGIALVGLAWQMLPASRHANGMFFALALPGHLALAWTLWRLDSTETAGTAL